MNSGNEENACHDAVLLQYFEEQLKKSEPASLLHFIKQNESYIIQTSEVCDNDKVMEQKWKCRFGLASKEYPNLKIEKIDDKDYWISLFCAVLERQIEQNKARMKLKRRWTAAQLQESETNLFSNELIQEQEEPNKRRKETGEDEAQDSLPVSSTKAAGSSNSSQCSYVSGDREDYLLSIWGVWEEFLEEAKQDDTKFLYSPERYGIITCGEGISAKPEMPLEEYKGLNKANSDKSDETDLAPFSEYVEHALNAQNASIMEERTRTLPKCPSPEPKAKAYYLQDMLLLFSRDIYRRQPNIDLSKSESVYNFYLVHPAIRATVAALKSHRATFIPGEEALQSMLVVLKQSGDLFTEREAYKADGIVRSKLANEEDDDGYEAEILLLETSNGYGVAKKSKSGFDHHKAMFALLSMIKSFADEYAMASFENLAEVTFYFLHAYEKKIRLWSFYTPSQGVYVMKRDWTITVPIKFPRRDTELHPFITHFWDLKKKLGVSIDKMKKMRQEHFYQAKRHRFNAFPKDKLLSTVVDPVIKNLTFGRDSKGMYDHLPDSSLAACSDDGDLQHAS